MSSLPAIQAERSGKPRERYGWDHERPMTCPDVVPHPPSSRVAVSRRRVDEQVIIGRVEQHEPAPPSEPTPPAPPPRGQTNSRGHTSKKRMELRVQAKVAAKQAKETEKAVLHLSADQQRLMKEQVNLLGLVKATGTAGKPSPKLAGIQLGSLSRVNDDLSENTSSVSADLARMSADSIRRRIRQDRKKEGKGSWGDLVVAAESTNSMSLESSDHPSLARGDAVLLRHLITAKQDNMKLLEKLIAAEEWRQQLRAKLDEDVLACRKEIIVLRELVARDNRDVRLLQASLDRQVDMTNRFSDDLRTTQLELSETKKALEMAERRVAMLGDANLGMRSTPSTLDSTHSHLTTQNLIIEKAHRTLDATKALNTSLKRRVEQLEQEKRTLEAKVEQLEDRLQSAKALITERERFSEAERRMVMQDKLGLESPQLDDGIDLTSIERMRYTPRPTYPRSLVERHGVETRHQSTIMIVDEMVQRLDTKHNELLELQAEVQQSREVVNAIARLEKRRNPNPGPSKIACRATFPPFLATPFKSVQNLFWGADVTTRWLTHLFESVTGLTYYYQNLDNRAFRSSAAATTAAIVALCVGHASLKRAKKKAAVTPPSSPQRGDGLRLGLSTDHEPPFARYMTRWLRTEFLDNEETRSRMAHNLVYHATQNMETDPLSRLFVLCCNGRVPLDVYSDLTDVLNRIREAFQTYDTRGTGRVAKNDALHILRQLFHGQPWTVWMRVKCAIAKDLESSIPQELMYMDAFSPGPQISHTGRVVAEHVIDSHLALYAKLEEVLPALSLNGKVPYSRLSAAITSRLAQSNEESCDLPTTPLSPTTDYTIPSSEALDLRKPPFDVDHFLQNLLSVLHVGTDVPYLALDSVLGHLREVVFRLLDP
eukprot:Sspe_Gene.86301::Locus_56987_Transcript_1_1_Confidence_1.000_Length_2714::g.86301::m.86301